MITMAFPPIVSGDRFGLFLTGGVHLMNEIAARRGEPAQRNHRVAFGVIVCDRQHLSPGGEPVRRAFDHLVRRLPGSRI